MCSRYHLTDQELDELEFEHRHANDKRYADRVKAVNLLGKGWSATKIAEALLIDRETVQQQWGNSIFLLSFWKSVDYFTVEWMSTPIHQSQFNRILDHFIIDSK